MRKTILLMGFVSTVAAGMQAPKAYADGAEVGASSSAVVAVGKFKRMVEGDVGGSFGLLGGYRWEFGEFSISAVGEPRFVLLPTEDSLTTEDDPQGTVILTGGPKLMVNGGILEAYVTAQGGYYRDVVGPLDDDGFGANAGAGLDFRITRTDSVGFRGRYDWAKIVAATNSNADRRFVSAGLEYTHVFRPAERPVVAQAPPPPASPPPPPTKRRIVLRGVNFDFDRANIRPDARPILDEAAQTLRDEPGIDVSVEGHTDAIGSDAYNQKLSERRARAVADYLTSRHVARSRLRTVGFGESKPVASNATEDGRAQNRRVELRIVGE